MGLGLGLRLWGSTVGHFSNSWASCLISVQTRSDEHDVNSWWSKLCTAI